MNQSIKKHVNKLLIYEVFDPTKITFRDEQTYRLLVATT